jgi:NADH:ubiquinone oxidoreductase subunit 6 (subunit J)
MILRGMNLPLIIACIVIVLALIILPLIVSYKAEKKEKNNSNEWDKIKEYGNKLNNKTREKN